MNCILPDIGYLEQAVGMAQAGYDAQCASVKALPRNDYRDVLREKLASLIKAGQGAFAIENGQLRGYMLFSEPWKRGDDGLGASMPLYGFGTDAPNRADMVSRLFEYAADRLVSEGVSYFNAWMYANDAPALTAFWLLQFAPISTMTIRSTGDAINGATCDFAVRELTPDEIRGDADGIASMYLQIAQRLRESPVFYPGREFTRELYTDFILSGETRIFRLYDGERPIGMIAASSDAGEFMLDAPDTMNVGDIYVLPEYRRTGGAQKLLAYLNDALRAEGVSRLWVEHGTANPNAIRFWDRHFQRFSYCLTRALER